MKRSTNLELLKAHNEAWRTLKAHPIYIEIDKLFDTLTDLQTWHLDRETFEQHNARYDAGKPQKLWAKIDALRLELYKTPENIRWFELYQKVNS